jgi:CPA1 family monovalent cation:H+ antiporter
MSLFNFISILIVLAGLFGYINAKVFKLPPVIGLMLIAILFSLSLLITSLFIPAVNAYGKYFVEQINFTNLVLNGMLSTLLFVGALRIDIEWLRKQQAAIIIFATVGVLISTFITGSLLFYLQKFLKLDLSFIVCLLFGALISPTDPVAVLGILQRAGIKKALEIKITGESLFNDGMGIVLFIILYQIAQGSINQAPWISAAILFAKEAGGGAILGYILGKIVAFALSTINEYEIEVMLTLAMVMGGYALTNYLGFSGPITMAVGGLIIGNEFRKRTILSEEGERYVFSFWELINAFLNAILFILIGLGILGIQFSKYFLVISFIAIPIVILSRFLTVYSLISLLKRWVYFDEKSPLYMTWGGLHGGVSIALALAIPDKLAGNLLVTITYVVATFSILVQGLSLQYFIRRQKERRE